MTDTPRSFAAAQDAVPASGLRSRLQAEVRPAFGGAQVGVAVIVSALLFASFAGRLAVARADERVPVRVATLARSTGPEPTASVSLFELVERLAERAGAPAGPAPAASTGPSAGQEPVAAPEVRYEMLPGETMVWPHPGPLTGWWGEGRGSRLHLGVDIDGEVGDPIVAAGPGRVLATGYMPGYAGYGIVVILEHGPVRTLYAHLDAVHVQPGQLVTAGHHIGNMGVSGAVTGSHLHFEVRVGDTPIDPGPWLVRR